MVGEDTAEASSRDADFESTTPTQNTMQHGAEREPEGVSRGEGEQGAAAPSDPGTSQQAGAEGAEGGDVEPSESMEEGRPCKAAKWTETSFEGVQQLFCSEFQHGEPKTASASEVWQKRSSLWSVTHARDTPGSLQRTSLLSLLPCKKIYPGSRLKL